MSDETATIAYSRVVDRRDRAIQLDLGEEKPVWFPLAKITLDESEYTLTGPKQLIMEKQAEARGANPQYNPFGKKLVKLEEPEWQNEKAIGIDITVTRLTIGRPAIRKRVFFQKSKLESTGKSWSAPLWLVQTKEREIIEEMTKTGHFAPGQFQISGLRAGESKPKKAKEPKKEAAPNPEPLDGPPLNIYEDVDFSPGH
jgi:hypothetical protein